MRRLRHIITCAALILLAACSDDFEDVGQAPALTPVGSSFRENAELVKASYPRPEAQESWIGGEADLFRDRKARQEGDIITVIIDIDDKASLNNNSNRSRKSNSDNSVGIGYPILGTLGAKLNGQAEVDSNTSSTGQGATARSEKVRISVAAVVTGTLPNGFLIIEGSQEVLVNFEARVLSVRGIVNPKEISADNRIAYDRIAEARIAYGGKGRLTEIQQPSWGQQIWDRVTPF
jgi:flagellar L-ring protein precursor FlgH